MKTEIELIKLAENHADDNIANSAMKELRYRFDETYIWCQDCDGLVCKEKDCCLNKELHIPSDGTKECSRCGAKNNYEEITIDFASVSVPTEIERRCRNCKNKIDYWSHGVWESDCINF